MTKTLTFALMDPPFENERSTTALRLIKSALEQGHNVNVFAYEGAVFLPFDKQQAHGNAIHNRDVEMENHPLPKKWISELLTFAQSKNLKLDWVNCGLCVDERGASEAVHGVRRGSPGDLVTFNENSDNSLIIATRS